MAFLGMVGGLVSAAGTVMGGVAQANADRYQAQVAANNAIIATNLETQAREAGRAQAMNKSLQAAEQLGGLKTTIAAHGVDVNTGSSKAALVSQREINALDVANVMYDAQLRAYGYKTQEYGYQAESKLKTAEAGQAELGGILGGAGQALGAASKWYSPSSSSGGGFNLFG